MPQWHTGVSQASYLVSPHLRQCPNQISCHKVGLLKKGEIELIPAKFQLLSPCSIKNLIY